MIRTIILLLAVTISGVCRAQTCLSQIQSLRNSFEQKKSNCAQSNLNSDYVGRAEPAFADKVPRCISLGKACIPGVQSYDSKAATCDARVKKATEKNATNNLTGYSDSVITAMNNGSDCVDAAVDDAYQYLNRAQDVCMSAQEGIFRANDQCDVDMTNLSVKVQQLQCQSQDPGEIASFQTQRSSLVSDIAQYANQMNSWGKKVAANVMGNFKSCGALFEQKVATKNAAVKDYMALSGQAYKVKREISSK